MKHIIAIILILFSLNLRATPEYGEKTGEDCKSCHINSNGEGLTPRGEEYLVSLMEDKSFEPVSTGKKIINTIAGLFHVLTGFIWFGAILYIHLILKPKYVAQGIPKGELKIGWISMLIMLATGIYLTFNRFPKLSMLLDSEIGILLLIKIGLFLFMVLTIIIVTAFIAPRLNNQSKRYSEKVTGEFNADELSYFDGKEGRPAYIAYNGDVFEVTHSIFWHNGQHLLKHSAGMDLTESMPIAPHTDSVLKGFIKKGIFINDPAIKTKPIIKLFYFLAYSVLVCIFFVILILSLWRWWY